MKAGQGVRRFTVRALAWWRVVAILATGVLLVSACGSSGTNSGGASPSASATPAANTAVCQDVAALRGSLSKLSHVTVSKGAASTLAANTKDVQAKLTTLTQDAGTQWNSQIGAFKAALSKLQAAVSGLANGGSLSSAGSALREVKTTAQNLLSAAGARCPSSSASS